MMAIIIFILVLSFLVIIHELGHFLTALLFGIHVEEFGLGYPPRAKTLFYWRSIPFTLNFLPFGGFVRMEGENGDEKQADRKNSSGKESHLYTGVPFNTKNRSERLIVVLAGAVTNFIFGVVAFTIIFSRLGIPQYGGNPTVQEVHTGPAKTAGVMIGDKIVAVGRKGESLHAVGSLPSLIQWLAAQPDTFVQLQLEHDGKARQVELRTRSSKDIASGLGAISVSLDQPTTFKFYSWYEMPFRSMQVGLQQSVEFSQTILLSLGNMGKQLFQQGKLPSEVSGPIGIVHEVQKQQLFAGGWLAILNFAAIISINLAIMNVLPIPALDGGRAFLMLLEIPFGRKRIAKIEPAINNIGMAFLLALILLISVKDIISIVK